MRVGSRSASPTVTFLSVGRKSSTSRPASWKKTRRARLNPLLWIPLLSIPIITSPSWILAPLTILSRSTRPIPVAAKSKFLTISGSEAVSPPIIAVFAWRHPSARPLAIWTAASGSGFSTAK